MEKHECRALKGATDIAHSSLMIRRPAKRRPRQISGNPSGVRFNSVDMPWAGEAPTHG